MMSLSSDLKYKTLNLIRLGLLVQVFLVQILSIVEVLATLKFGDYEDKKKYVNFVNTRAPYFLQIQQAAVTSPNLKFLDQNTNKGV